MHFRMSPQTFFLLLSQALKPEFNRVVLYLAGDPNTPAGFHFLNLPVTLDASVPRGQFILEEKISKPN